MVTKLFEIRDHATLIVAMAVKLESKDPAEMWLMWRAGFPADSPADTIALIHLVGDQGHIDPYAWKDTRTMRNAHIYILNHFDKLKTGDVVDVEYVLGEVDAPKVSERAERIDEKTRQAMMSRLYKG